MGVLFRFRARPSDDRNLTPRARALRLRVHATARWPTSRRGLQRVAARPSQSPDREPFHIHLDRETREMIRRLHASGLQPDAPTETPGDEPRLRTATWPVGTAPPPARQRPPVASGPARPSCRVSLRTRGSASRQVQDRRQDRRISRPLRARAPRKQTSAGPLPYPDRHSRRAIRRGR